MITYDNWGKPFPQIPPNSNDKIRYFTIIYELIYEFSLQLQKPLENAHFLSFSRGLTCILSRNLVSHLSCNFCCKVFLFLFDSFTCLKTNKSLNSYVCIVFFCNFFYIFSNCKVTVLNICLI